jgi:ATP-binding cassette, subfamily D (ALD), peroxisomal long-chain fatty acid import protein
MASLSKQWHSLPPSSRRPLIIFFATLLILRSRAITGPLQLLSKLKVVARGTPLTPDELAHVLEQVYIKQADGSKTLLVPIQDRYVSEVSPAVVISA